MALLTPYSVKQQHGECGNSGSTWKFGIQHCKTVTDGHYATTNLQACMRVHAAHPTVDVMVPSACLD